MLSHAIIKQQIKSVFACIQINAICNIPVYHLCFIFHNFAYHAVSENAYIDMPTAYKAGWPTSTSSGDLVFRESACKPLESSSDRAE